MSNEFVEESSKIGLVRESLKLRERIVKTKRNVKEKRIYREE